MLRCTPNYRVPFVIIAASLDAIAACQQEVCWVMRSNLMPRLTAGTSTVVLSAWCSCVLVWNFWFAGRSCWSFFSSSSSFASWSPASSEGLGSVSWTIWQLLCGETRLAWYISVSKEFFGLDARERCGFWVSLHDSPWYCSALVQCAREGTVCPCFSVSFRLLGCCGCRSQHQNSVDQQTWSSIAA